MGVVYLARDPILDRDVAIKILTAGALSGDQNERFEREARAIAKLDHPGIVQIYDFARFDGTPFFVMPFIEGQTLRSVQKDSSLKPHEILEIGAQVADALNYSHVRGIVHRDVKPENIMAIREGDEWRAKIMDFGIALGPKDDRMTRSDIIVGTLAYLPPESIIDSATSPHADIYSLGVVLYEALSGRLPFSGDTQTMLYKIVHSDPEQPGLLASLVDGDTENLVLSCLAKAPSARPKTGAELAGILKELARRMRTPGATGGIAAVLGAPAARGRIVGREHEFEELGKAFHRAQAGEAQLALVGGDHGYGKGSLLSELERAAKNRGALVLRGRFIERTDPALPYQGFGEAFREYLASKQSSPKDQNALRDFLPELTALFPELQETTGSGEWSPLAGVSRNDRSSVFDLLAKCVGRLAADQPLLLIFEDLHLADVSLEAIQYVFRRRSSSRLLIAASYVPEPPGESGPLSKLLRTIRNDPRTLLVQLRPLTAAACHELAKGILGEDRVPGGAGEALLVATGGNPFFVSELARSLSAPGRFEAFLEGGGDSAASIAIPSSVQKLADDRIAGLSQSEQAFLTAAAVVGSVFTPDEIAQISGLGDKTDQALESLIERDILSEDETTPGRLTFTSSLLRDASYRTLPQSRRRALHRGYAEFLEAKFARRLDRVAPALIRHFVAAGLLDRAAPHSLTAARGALAAGAFEDARRFARGVIEATQSPDWLGDVAVEAEARMLWARGADGVGDYAAATSMATEAASGFESIQDARGQAEALLLAAQSSHRAMHLDEAKVIARQGHDVATAHALVDLFPRFSELLSQVQDSRASASRAVDTPLLSGVLAATPSASGSGSGAGMLVAEAEYLAAEEAFVGADEASRLSDRTGRDDASVKLIHLADLSLRIGRFQRGVEASTQAIDLVDPTDALTRVSLGVLHGTLLTKLGRPREAVKEGEATASLASKSRDSVPRAIELQVAAMRARALLGLGDLANARSIMESAGPNAVSLTGGSPPKILLTYADILTAQGDRDLSRQLIDVALQGAESTSDMSVVAQALESRARLLLRCHLPDEAMVEARRGLALGQDVGEAGVTTGLRLVFGWCLQSIGEVGAADIEFLSANREAEAMGARLQSVNAQLGLSATNLARGRVEAAEIAARLALQFSSAAGARILEARAERALGQVLAATRNSQDSISAFERACEIADACGDAPLHSDALISLAGALRNARQLDVAKLRAMEAWNGAAERGDVVRRGLAMIEMARVEALQGRAAEGVSRLAAVAAAAQSEPARRFALTAYEALIESRIATGDGTGAVRDADLACEAAERLENGGLPAVVAAHFMRARAIRAIGDLSALRIAIQRTMTFADGGADRILQSRAGIDCARLCAEADPDLAIGLLEKAAQRAHDADAFAMQAAAAAEIAQIHTRVGRLKEARESIEVEEKALQSAGLPVNSLRLKMRKARILEISGDLKGCADLVESESAPGDDQALAIRFLASRARVKLVQGRLRHAMEDAEGAVRRASGLSGRDWNAAHVERARGFLARADVVAAEKAVAEIQANSPSMAPFELAFFDMVRSGVALLKRDGEGATRFAENACASFERNFNDVWAASARLLVAKSLAFRRSSSADRVAGLVESLATARGWTLLRVEAVALRGRIAGDLDRLSSAFDLERRVGSPWILASVAHSKAQIFKTLGQTGSRETEERAFGANIALLASDLSPQHKNSLIEAISGGIHPFA